MIRRPLLDYIADREAAAAAQPESNGLDALSERLKMLEDRLSEAAVAPKPEMTEQPIAGQIEAILKRRDGLANAQPIREDRFEPPVNIRPDPSLALASRLAISAPPLAFAEPDVDHPPVPDDFVKFAEAIRLIGQAAGRFIPPPAEKPAMPVGANAAADIAALAVVVQDAVLAFRSLADDIAVSASEIRRYVSQAPAVAAPRAVMPVAPAPQAAPVAPVPRRNESWDAVLSDLDALRRRITSMMQENP